MAQIIMTPETLLEQAKTLRSKKAQQEQLYQDIRSQVQNITSVWKGKSQEAFWASFDARDKQFRQFAEDIEAFARLMDTAANEMQQTEDSLTGKMKI